MLVCFGVDCVVFVYGVLFVFVGVVCVGCLIGFECGVGEVGVVFGVVGEDVGCGGVKVCVV